jgi:hypothetical protein
MITIVHSEVIYADPSEATVLEDDDEISYNENEMGEVIFEGTLAKETEASAFYVELYNETVNDFFCVYLETYNHLVSKEKLPFGKYEVSGGGLRNGKSGFDVSGDMKFEVSDNSKSVKVKVVFGDDNVKKEKSEFTENKKKTNSHSDVIVKTPYYVYVVCIAVGIIILAVIVFIIKFIRSRNDF